MTQFGEDRVRQANAAFGSGNLGALQTQFLAGATCQGQAARWQPGLCFGGQASGLPSGASASRARGHSHPGTRVVRAAKMAATDRSTSASVVRQLDTEMRIRRLRCQLVAPIQHSPERCTASMTRVVSSSLPKLTSTWLSTTSLTTVTPSAALSCSAKRPARAQHRSTSSATPDRPSWRSAAQVAKPLARREELRHVVARSARAVLALAGQVGGGVGHGSRVSLRVGAEGVAAVIGDIEPLVAVSGPRVGPLDSGYQVTCRGARCRP